MRKSSHSPPDLLCSDTGEEMTDAFSFFPEPMALAVALRFGDPLDLRDEGEPLELLGSGETCEGGGEVEAHH